MSEFVRVGILIVIAAGSVFGLAVLIGKAADRITRPPIPGPRIKITPELRSKAVAVHRVGDEDPS